MYDVRMTTMPMTMMVMMTTASLLCKDLQEYMPHLVQQICDCKSHFMACCIDLKKTLWKDMYMYIGLSKCSWIEVQLASGE